MRPLLAVLSIAVLAATASAQPAPPAAVPGEALFVVSGQGWGHGVGMSQYGAYGQALAGRRYDQILAHYYSGTELGPARTKEVRVLLAEGRRAVTVSSTVPFTAIDAAGQTYRLPKGPLALRAGLEFRTEEGAVAPVSPVVIRPGKKVPLALDGRLYRGKLEIAAQADFLRVVNVVALESYLDGVVAGEVPHTWPLETLKAQAVAARSYALASFVKGKAFDLYSDVRSQVYLGVAGEKARTSEAVDATAGEVVFYGGRVATTYYFSTSGGKTASAADVFGFSVPYLISRPDPWDKLSPYHRWGPVLLGARTVQAKLRIEPRVVDATGVVTPSGRLRTVVLSTTAGSQSVPSSLIRTALGLRSTWISVGVLRLDRASGVVVFGSAVHLSGIARGLPSPTLASSSDGAAWSAAGQLVREASGAVALDIKPVRTTRYRIEVEGAASPALLVQVAPRLQLGRPSELEPSVLTGTVRPKLPGATVAIERRKGSAWVPVGEAEVDGVGAFRLELTTLVSGSYRARIPATGGLVAGTSPVLQVTG